MEIAVDHWRTIMDIFDYAGCKGYADPLRRSCAAFGIIDPGDVARFLAQVSVESAGFTTVTENLSYRAAGLLAVCNGRNGVDTLAAAQAVVDQGHEAVANALYGGSWGLKMLGNTNPGDGARFIGHGLIQLTGRDNHKRASYGVHNDDRYVVTPSLLTVAVEAAASAAWFWMSKGLNGIADVAVVTKRINGGANALAARQAMTDRLLNWTDPA